MYTLLVERYADDPATIYRPTEFRAVLEEYRQRLQKSEGNR
jgi:hypothetical protein